MKCRHLAVLLVVVLSACDRSEKQATERPGGTAAVSGVEQLVPDVVRRLPHDPWAYTQGLVFHDGRLYESTGQYGQSTVRIIDPSTGKETRSVSLPVNAFGEGLAATPTSLVQLTWKELVAYYYDPETLALQKSVPYTGEGWGLCHADGVLYMTTGGDILVRRDAATFDLLGTVQITRGGQPLHLANELECVGDDIWANVYGTTTIVRMDRTTGRVTAEVDARSVVPAGVNPASMDHVLNGIAYNPESGTYYITGKLWPVLLEVRFVPR